MSIRPGFRWLRNLFRRLEDERELDQELNAYLDLVAAEKRSRGMSEPEAARAARLELGGLDQVKEEVRAVRSGIGLETLARDVRYGARLLRRNPVFTLVATVSLALGVGATSSVFQLVDALRLRRLPVPRAGELYEIRVDGPGRMGRLTGRNRQATLPIWEQIQARQEALSGLA